MIRPRFPGGETGGATTRQLIRRASNVLDVTRLGFMEGVAAIIFIPFLYQCLSR